MITEHFENPYWEALVTTAKAYLARRAYLQYDDTRLVAGSATPVTYRWQYGHNAPEDSTVQHTCYTNCAAFCYDVYFEALGYDIVTWSTEKMYKRPDRHVFLHRNTFAETPEEKEAIKREYLATLQPGDIVLCRHEKRDGGHAMLYVGGGKVLHSATPGHGGNYDYAAKKECREPSGSIAYMDVSDLFEKFNGWYFWEEKLFAIVRPLLGWDQPIPEKTKNRVAHLQNITVSKLCSAAEGQTVEPGGELTYTFDIRSAAGEKTVLDVTDELPENTELVSAEGAAVCGRCLSWKIMLQKGENAKLSYTVRVKNCASLAGKAIISEKAAVGGVSVKARQVYVGGTLSEEKRKTLAAAVERGLGSGLRGFELAKKIYADAGLDIGFDDPQALMHDLWRPYGGTDTHLELNLRSRYFPILAPTLYGGRYVSTAGVWKSVRTRGLQPCHLTAGDIVVLADDRNAEKITLWLYAGDRTLVDLSAEAPCKLSVPQSAETLWSALGYYSFAVIRPAMKAGGKI